MLVNLFWMPIPSPIYLYRIIHIDNLLYILNQGQITCPNHANADPDYIGIGDSTLIEQRNEMVIELPPNGTFSDYVSFYFGMRSPMLYNIRNGYQGVTRRHQQQIIYLVSSYERILESKIKYVFFDGHGYHHYSQPFNTNQGLQQIDWDIVKSRNWNDPDQDSDRKRRKQAEFLAYQTVPLDNILGIAVFNDSSMKRVKEILNVYNLSIKVLVKQDWYY